MSVASVPKAAFNVADARKEAHAFRGSVLNSYSRLEMAVTSLLESARLFPDYAAIARKPPHLLSQKLDLLEKLAATEGAWKAKLALIVPHLHEIRPYDEVRNLLSHGVLKVAHSEDDEVLYLFEMLRPSPAGLQRIPFHFTDAQAEQFRKQINLLVNRVAQSLGYIGQKPIAQITPFPMPAVVKG